MTSFRQQEQNENIFNKIITDGNNTSKETSPFCDTTKTKLKPFHKVSKSCDIVMMKTPIDVITPKATLEKI